MELAESTRKKATFAKANSDDEAVLRRGAGTCNTIRPRRFERQTTTDR